MAFDTKAPLIGYRNLFNVNGYRARVQSIVSNLNSNYNFKLRSTDLSYGDFWGNLTNINVLGYVDFDATFDEIEILSQSVNDMLEARYMDYIGMVMSLDNYICYATDAFSRIADSIWSFGDGQIYANKTGKLLPDGTYEIVRKGLEYYYNEINALFDEMETYISTDPGPTAAASVPGMSLTKDKDTPYLEWKRDNYFVPKIMAITQLLNDALVECQDIYSFLVSVNKAITKWLIESFKLVSYINLAFNLSKKTESVANKIINFSTGVTTTSIIAVNQAKFWKKQVLPDLSNNYQCLISAVEAGLVALTYPSMLESFIDDTWERIIPSYGM